MGGGSVWYCNAKADVSQCTCEISGLGNISCYDHMKDVCCIYCPGAAVLTGTHVAHSVSDVFVCPK